jgi:hypothetical protein
VKRFSIEEIHRDALFADPHGEHAQKNLVDALFAIADSIESVSSALRALGNGDAATRMGAIEAHGMTLRNTLKESIAEGCHEIAEAIADVSAGIEDHRKGRS